MNKRNNLRLYEFQKTLYQKALDEAANHSPFDAPSIMRYSEQFYKSLPKKFTKSNLDSVLKQIDKSDVLLYGDFHTHRQTQKGLIRILENYIALNEDRDIVLALEMFRAIDQENINRFLKGEITEQELMKLCDYEKYWGFPWENYRLMIDFAIANNIQIIGINTDLAEKTDFLKEIVLRHPY